MEKAGLYNGISGEVVRGLLNYHTVISMLPVMFLWLVLFGLIHLFDGRGASQSLDNFLLISAVIIYSYVTGRFAIPASRGDFDAGFFNAGILNGDMPSFVTRNIIYNLLWFLPFKAISYGLLNSNNHLEIYFFLKLGISLGGWAVIWYAILVLLVFFGPMVAALLTIYTQFLSDVLSVEPLFWILKERCRDLASYFSQIIGVTVLFFIKYLIPLIILKIIAFKISIKFGLYVTKFMTLLPLIVTPIIIGRLSGVFVAVERLKLDQFIDNKEKGQPTPNGFMQGEKKDYEHLLSVINTMTIDEIKNMIASLKAKKSNIYKQLSLCYLYQKAGNQQEIISESQQAIRLCFQEGMGYEAVKLFRNLVKERNQLKLTVEELTGLAHFLTEKNYYADAAWCYMMAIRQMPEEEQLGLHKKFLHMADLARRHASNETANQLYQLFCNEFPDSPLSEFAKSQITVETRGYF